MEKHELSKLLLKIQRELQQKFPNLKNLELHYTDNKGIRYDELSIQAYKGSLFYGGLVGNAKEIKNLDENFVKRGVSILVKLVGFKELNNVSLL